MDKIIIAIDAQLNRAYLMVGLLGPSFVVLKLLGKIDWSWWYITAPFWFGIACSLIFYTVVFAVSGIIVLHASDKIEIQNGVKHAK